MANTIIKIKNSSTTSAPANAVLQTAEFAYSFLSDTLYIGNTTQGAIAIGGKRIVDLINTVFGVANTGGNSGPAAFDKANSANVIASSAFDKANSANVLAFNSGTIASAGFDKANSGNIIASAAFDKANSANVLAFNALPKAGGTITGDLVIQGNATISGTTTYANTQTLLIGDNILTLNADLPPAVAPSENAGLEVNRGSSTNTAIIWNEGNDVWTFTNDGSTYYAIPTNTAVIAAQTTASAGFDKANSANVLAYNTSLVASAGFDKANSANVLAYNTSLVASAGFDKANAANVLAFNNGTIASTAFDKANAANVLAYNTGIGANSYAALVAGAANTNAANGSYISTGIVAVGVGGTGVTSFTTNGVLYGNNAGPLKVTSAGTEGQVLQASITGIPHFGILDGGVF